jgi:fluoroacetyl-CoA thioesterase
MASVGDVGKSSFVVESSMLASKVGSGSVHALSTPFLVALAEAAACNALEGKLVEGDTSVGTSITAHHTLATPVGERVEAQAVITGVDGRKISFSFEAWDQAKQKIGHGTHERFVLNSERFHTKLKK